MRHLLADVVLVAHFCLAASIVIGLVAILSYPWHRWQWVLDMRLRALHAAAIVTVALESVLGIRCPLTAWEDALRDASVEAGFVERWVSRLLYFDFPTWVFTSAYVLAASATLLAWFVLPPRRASNRAARKPAD